MKAHNSRSIKRRVQGLIKRKRSAEAITVLREAAASDPGDATLLCTLGGLLAGQGETEQALGTLERALALDPKLAEAHRRRGALLADRGDPGLAEAAFKQALALTPKDSAALVALGDLYLHNGRPGDAAGCYETALKQDPRTAGAHFGYAAVLAGRHRVAQATWHLQQAVGLEPRSTSSWEALGACAERSQQYDLAIKAYKRAAALAPRSPGAAADLARVLEHMGEHQAAQERLEPFLGQRPLAPKVAVAFSRIAPHVGRIPDAIAAARQALEQGPEEPGRIEILFHLGQLLDKTGDYEGAFAAFDQANRLRHRGFDRNDLVRNSDRLIRTFDRGCCARLPRSGMRSEQPVFVVGMMRSGTTLVEQILASHPRIHGAGELHDLNLLVKWVAGALPDRTYPEGLPRADPAILARAAGDYLERQKKEAGAGVERIVDKTPTNFRHLGLVALLFPGARVIHCVRDPLDTCLSIYSLNFDGHHPYAFDQEDLGFYYREYERLMAHWKRVLDIPILDVRYEELVGDQEAQSRRMVEFLGLEWNDACLRFHDSGRKAHTASYDQVRRPIYTSSMQRWRHYDKQLQPLRDALEKYAAAADPA